MNDKHKDQSDYTKHLHSVLAGREEADKKDLETIAEIAKLSEAPDFDVQRGYLRLRAQLTLKAEERRRRKRRTRHYTIGAVAAAIIGVMVTILVPRSGVLFNPGTSSMMAKQIQETYFLPDSLAGDRDLVLEREDGSRLYLKMGDKDSLKLKDVAPLFAAKEMVTMIVPETRRGTVVLDDGTVVTLNSVSSLRMPVTFGKHRSVELKEGEALMDVAQDKKRPFTVDVEEMRLEVLGTTFDVCLYPEQHPTAALIEGSLKVTDRQGKSVVLAPGEEALYMGEEGGLVHQASDLAVRTAWVNGIFIFKHLPLSSIMQYLERWYGFNTIYMDDAFKQNTYTGALRREYSREFVFELLETTTELKINNKPEDRYVVMQHR
ncbi:MAG: FecR domain-containing protein [Porphyromonas sp.]|nr:FecR domain-containing protein [Porphyromonas sp.]